LLDHRRGRCRRLSGLGQDGGRRRSEERRHQHRHLSWPWSHRGCGLLGWRGRLGRRDQDMSLLEIKNLHAEVDGRKILNGLDLTVEKGSVHAIMGPNGSGKSTLAHVLAGKDGYEVTEGSVRFDGEDLLALEPDERAAKGLFLAFQYPLEIPGVATMTF